MTNKRIYKPKNDNEFLEQLSFIRFASGFRYSVVEAKWPNIKKAFNNFNVKKVAAYTEKDVERLMKSKDMIKHHGKISDIITNAKICRQIAEENGSVLKWIENVKKQHSKDPIFAPYIRDEFRRFRGIGEMTSGWLESLHMAKKDYLVYQVP